MAELGFELSTKSWGIPLAITVAAVCLQKIGYDASEVSVGWCWVSIKEKDHVLWMLLTGKIWELLAYIILPVLYILIKRHVHKAHAALLEYRPILANNRLSYSFPSMADRKLTFIPIIFITLRIWSTVRFVLFLLDSPARQNPVLVTLHGIGNSFQGAANCILFVLCTRPVRTRLVDWLCCRTHDAHPGSGMPPHHTDNSHTYSNPDDSSIPHIWQDGGEDG
ncbi:G-protein coupled receptor 157 isoform X2 [Trichomycterus rosablanca]|uniref:G-protein coupled receptor 157 isoform X2 n=1 Tax=Trichomycterus rosablanca TaxID=2290929 RepID=UPI002F3518E9